jgi:hypothetical protein
MTPAVRTSQKQKGRIEFFCQPDDVHLPQVRLCNSQQLHRTHLAIGVQLTWLPRFISGYSRDEILGAASVTHECFEVAANGRIGDAFGDHAEKVVCRYRPCNRLAEQREIAGWCSPDFMDAVIDVPADVRKRVALSLRHVKELAGQHGHVTMDDCAALTDELAMQDDIRAQAACFMQMQENDLLARSTHSVSFPITS